MVFGVSSEVFGGLSNRLEAAGAGSLDTVSTNGEKVAAAVVAVGVTASAAFVPEYGGGGMNGDVAPDDDEGAGVAGVVVDVAPGVK